MTLTLTLTAWVLLVVGSFICALVSAAGKCPLWVAVVLLAVAVLIGRLG